MRVLGFHHLAIAVRDLEGLSHFYREVLALDEMARHRREDGTVRSIWLELPGGGFLALEESPGATKVAGQKELGLTVLALGISAADRQQVANRLARLGVPILKQTRWTLYFDDPEGNHLALSHFPQAGEG